jgi:hypothetical protein
LAIGPVTGSLSASENRLLYRALLSSFADNVYTRCEGVYLRNGEERQLDRTSLLQEIKPAMIAGLPFDLVVQREDTLTGSREERLLPLLTFCSELSLAQLEELQPFSYDRRQVVEVLDGTIRMTDQVHFGGCLLTSMAIEPPWKNPVEMAPVADKALEWFFSHREELPLQPVIARVRDWFEIASGILKCRLEPFEFHLREFLRRELQRQLNIADLRFFFSFHTGFFRLTLRQLLPFSLLTRLKRAGWPATIPTTAGQVAVSYRRRKAFLVLDSAAFLTLSRDELLLPTGETAGVILDGQPFDTWPEAVESFNAGLRRRIFDDTWRPLRKPARLADLQEIEFPASFSGGHGKENVSLEYFMIPEIEDQAVVLTHHLDPEEAGRRFREIQPQFEELMRRHRQEALSSIFRTKGWKVK